MSGAINIRQFSFLAALLLCLGGFARQSLGQCCGAELQDDRITAASDSNSSKATSASTDSSAKRILRIAADPNNLPFTNDKLEGFENKIADLLAEKLDAQIQYLWRPQRRGFFQATLKTGQADLVLGVPSGMRDSLTTRPYYRSSYVFVSRKDRGLAVHSFDEPSLARFSIGVQLLGKDGESTPPVHELAVRGLADNVRGFMVRGDAAQESPSAPIIESVDNKEIDLAIAWGPLAGWLAKSRFPELEITPIRNDGARHALPMGFDICIGVSSHNQSLCDELDRVLERRASEVHKILDDYGIPRQESPLAGEATGGKR